ncbi:MAG TPA: hypothetical protein VGM23_18460 [Armatimonadota bacterium]|jgi:hypothetical protein
MADEHSRERRRFFRLPYPEGAVRPTILTLDGSFPVSEISEKGLRFVCRRAAMFKLHQPVKATVRFLGGETCLIEGHVLRMTADAVILFLTKGIPLNKIVEEQRMLINKARSSR